MEVRKSPSHASYRLLLRVYAADNLRHVSSQGAYCKIYVHNRDAVEKQQRQRKSHRQSLRNFLLSSTSSTSSTASERMQSDSYYESRMSSRRSSLNSMRMSRISGSSSNSGGGGDERSYFKVAKTQVQKVTRGANPTWNEKFELPVGDPLADVLYVRVKSARLMSSTTIGACYIAIKDLQVDNTLDRWVPLEVRKKDAGRIRLQMRLIKQMVPQSMSWTQLSSASSTTSSFYTRSINNDSQISVPDDDQSGYSYSRESIDDSMSIIKKKKREHSRVSGGSNPAITGRDTGSATSNESDYSPTTSKKQPSPQEDEHANFYDARESSYPYVRSTEISRISFSSLMDSEAGDSIILTSTPPPSIPNMRGTMDRSELDATMRRSKPMSRMELDASRRVSRQIPSNRRVPVFSREETTNHRHVEINEDTDDEPATEDEFITEDEYDIGTEDEFDFDSAKDEDFGLTNSQEVSFDDDRSPIAKDGKTLVFEDDEEVVAAAKKQVIFTTTNEKAAHHNNNSNDDLAATSTSTMSASTSTGMFASTSTGMFGSTNRSVFAAEEEESSDDDSDSELETEVPRIPLNAAVTKLLTRSSRNILMDEDEESEDDDQHLLDEAQDEFIPILDFPRHSQAVDDIDCA